jgi:hypothetical protein
MKQRYSLLVFLGMLLCSAPSFAQNFEGAGQIHGNFELNAQLYSDDSTIGAPEVAEKFLMNGYLNLQYINGPFTAGLRYEAYLNPMLGYDPGYAGNGIPYRFASFKKDYLEITVGNFYEQFGNGLILRTYEDKALGIDNSLDGIRIKVNPAPGITIKGVVGNQRYYWAKSKGIVRGIDGEIDLNQAIKGLEMSKTRIILGGSFVSKYQKDDPSSKYVLPQNVGAFGGRIDIMRGKIHLQAEYDYKINDPTVLNNWIYKDGQALFVQASYSRKGLGVTLAAKRIDNMNYRSDRNVTGSPLTLSYLPPLTRQQSYSLATVYPYATQPNGETGLYGEVLYKLKKGTLLGGKYGTDVNINYSAVFNIDKQPVNDTTSIGEAGTLGYTSEYFNFSEEIFFKEFNIEITHKFNQRFKGIVSYLNQVYNIDVIEGHPGDPMVYTNVGILDVTYMMTETKALHAELQGLWTKQDKGDWAQFLLEYSIAPTWFVSLMDQYNYGNPEEDMQLHYYQAAFGYTKGSSRVALSWGRQRQGILCVGGVCRAVPASNGFQISITSSF